MFYKRKSSLCWTSVNSRQIFRKCGLLHSAELEIGFQIDRQKEFGHRVAVDLFLVNPLKTII